jgi:hypothetical protein
MATIANINPYTSSQVFKKEIAFSTVDEISGQNITEGYTVIGPSNSSITSISIARGRKCVVPITSDNGEGAPYLKFHFPNGTSENKMYLTFAVRNSRMADGYYDYTTGIPTDYKNKLKQFIISEVSTFNQSKINGVKTKELRFTSYGSSTNKPAEAITCYVEFRALFDTSANTGAVSESFDFSSGPQRNS